MHISGRKFKDGSSYVEGNGCKDDGVVVKFEANVNIKGGGVYSVSICNNSFGPLVKENY